MRQTIDVARFVSSILPTALQRNYVHRTLVAFYVGTILDFIGKSKTLDDGVLAFLLPAILTPLQAEGKESKELTVCVILFDVCRCSPPVSWPHTSSLLPSPKNTIFLHKRSKQYCPPWHFAAHRWLHNNT